jgi:hypothetical protein
MKKTQLNFEDFLVGFLMFFGLASTVFLFINNGGGSDIDFFNMSVYQEDKFELDFVYLTIYDDDIIDTSKYSFDPINLELNFSLRRTTLPSGDYLVQYSNMPVKVIISWYNYTGTYQCFSCQNCPNNQVCTTTITNVSVKDEKIIPYTFKFNNETVESNILRGDEVKYTYVFNNTYKTFKNANCGPTNITLRIEIVSDYFEESSLANNEYNITVPFCFYESIDLT